MSQAIKQLAEIVVASFVIVLQPPKLLHLVGRLCLLLLDRAYPGVAQKLPYCDAGGTPFADAEFETMVVSTRTRIAVEFTEVRWSHYLAQHRFSGAASGFYVYGGEVRWVEHAGSAEEDGQKKFFLNRGRSQSASRAKTSVSGSKRRSRGAWIRTCVMGLSEGVCTWIL